MFSCFMSKEEKESKRIHNEIEKQLKIDKRNLVRQTRVLLLGGSGKSTILKQMRIIHGEGYSVKDRRDFIKFVFRNIFDAISSLIYAMRNLEIPYSDDKNTEYAKMISSVKSYTVDTVDARYAEAIKSLWRDCGMQQCYERRTEFQLLGSAKYFLDDLDRIFSADYLPTNQDILRTRVNNFDCWDYSFDVGSVILRMFELGPRRKEWQWICPFQNVTAIIFMATLSNYDRSVFYAKENRMQESVDCFGIVTGYRLLRWAGIILFLNKTDLFQEKIFTSHLADYFPEYRGPKCDPEAAKKFIREMYEGKIYDGRPVYTHYTCAIDTENIRQTFESVKDTVARMHFNNMKLL